MNVYTKGRGKVSSEMIYSEKGKFGVRCLSLI